jgi:hypothetical protein
MHWHLFVKLWERVCRRRLHWVDKLGWVGGIVVLGWWEEIIRDGRGVRGMDVLFLGVGPGDRVDGFQGIVLNWRRRGDGD